MATFDPTKPPLSLEDKLAASPPATSVTGTTKLLTPSLETVEVRLTQLAPAERAAAGDTVQVIGALNEDGSYDAATLAAIAVKRAEGWPDNAIYVNIIGALPPVNTKTPAERAADGEVVQVLGYTTAEGGYDAATLALIADKQAAGWPDYSIWVRVLGTSATGPASASAMVPAFAAMAAFMSPTVAGQQVATGTVVQFSAMAAFVSPTVTAQQFATASVPQFAASATFAAPSVSVTPAGATAATVTVPSFGAVATFAAPSVTAQGAATASVPSFSAMASLSAPSVTGVVQTLATVIVPQFAATSTFASPAVSAQRAATVAIPSLSATSTLTNPSVAATRVATASVPSFGATAAFAAPTVAGVQQAAAVSATATVPSLTARATLTAPSVAGTTVSSNPGITEGFTTGPTSWPGVGDIGYQWSRSGAEVSRDATAKSLVFNLYTVNAPRWAEVVIPSMVAGKLDLGILIGNTDYGEWSAEVLCNGSRVYYNPAGGYGPINPSNIAYPSGTNTFKFILTNLNSTDELTLFLDFVRWVPNS